MYPALAIKTNLPLLFKNTQQHSIPIRFAKAHYFHLYNDSGDIVAWWKLLIRGSNYFAVPWPTVFFLHGCLCSKKFPDPAEDKLPGGVIESWTLTLVVGVSTAPVSSWDSTQEEAESVDATLPRVWPPLSSFSDKCDPEKSLAVVLTRWGELFPADQLWSLGSALPPERRLLKALGLSKPVSSVGDEEQESLINNRKIEGSGYFSKYPNYFNHLHAYHVTKRHDENFSKVQRLKNPSRSFDYIFGSHPLRHSERPCLKAQRHI